MLNQILVRNVSIFDAVSGSFLPGKDILIEDGIVAAVGEGLEAKPGCEIVAAEGLCASAGWTDAHTHLPGLDPTLTHPALGATAIHDAGSFGAFNYEILHEKVAKIPFPVTTYLYVGCWGMNQEGHDELITLDNLKIEPFCEVAAKYPGEIVGAKIRIDPRVNSDTKLTLRQAKEAAVKAGLPLAVHPSRTKDSLEEILEVLGKDDIYSHVYSSVCPSLFDEEGKIKQCVWDAVERGVRFEIAHGSNNFSYEIARNAFSQGFVADCISTDLHEMNFTRPAMDLAGLITKVVHCGLSLEEALKRVIVAPVEMLKLKKQTSIEVGKRADITLFRVFQENRDLSDSIKVVETCETQVESYATIIGGTLTHSAANAFPGTVFWS